MKRVLVLSHNSSARNFLFASFGVLGFTALVFQIVFAKNLVLIFGLTAPATATVLAVYFTGLALGGFIFGKLVDKFSEQALRIYAALFLGSGLYCLFTPVWFAVLKNIILAINKIYPLNFSGFNFFAIILAFLFLVVPSVFIGGGLPVITKILAEGESTLSKKISQLYFVDVLGSALGAFFSGFLFLPVLGSNITVVLAAVVNLVFGTILYFSKKINIAEGANSVVDFSVPSDGSACLPVSEGGEILKSELSVSNRFFLAVLFLTGFLAMALEIFYIKTMVLFIGSSTYAFSLVLVVFLLGMALGSVAFSYFIDRMERGLGYFGMFCGFLGFLLFLTVRFFEQIPFLFLKIFGMFTELNFFAIVMGQLILLAIVIFPVAFLIGVIFPLGIKLASPSERKIGEGLGLIYFSNTIGGVVGSLVGGFIMLPVLGYQKTAVLILVVYFFVAAIFILKERLLDLPIRIILIIFIIFWAWFACGYGRWSPKIMSSGSFVYAPDYLRFTEDVGYGDLKKGILSDELLFYKEGLSQVAVLKRGDKMFLRINGKTDASNEERDMEHEILTGVLPLMLHEDPKDVLMIGLGSGISLGSALQFDQLKNVEMVELDPAVVEAAKYFKNFNHNALNNLRSKIILSDGRNFLSLTDKKYDVISSQPSNLWVSGNSYLFTKEYYELVKSHLKDGGLMCQWVQMYGFKSDDIGAILKTFSEVFPSTYVFGNVNGTDLFLVGSPSVDYVLDFETVKKKIEEEKIYNELSRVYIFDAFDFMSYLVGTKKGIENITNNLKIHGDDRPFLEYSAPSSLFKGVDKESSANVLKLREETFAKLYSNVGADDKKIIDGLDDKEKDKFKNYLLFQQKIIFLIAALRDGDLDLALEIYKEAQETGVVNMIVQTRLINSCKLQAEVVGLRAGQEAGEKELQKCEFVFNNVPAK